MEPISAGIMAGGALLGGALSSAGQARANSQNIDVARESREWEAHMSNSSHQREVTDLKAAGLNPILSVNAGASSPNAQNPTMENANEGLASTAKDMIAFKLQMENQRNQNNLMEAQKAAALAEERSKTATAKNTNTQTEALIAQLPAIKKQAEYDAKFGDVDAYGKRLQYGTEAVQILKNLVNPFSSGASKNAPKDQPKYSPLPKL